MLFYVVAFTDNKTKGHKKPAKFRVEDFKVTNQIKELNKRITKLNESLNRYDDVSVFLDGFLDSLLDEIN
jgi:hypothetical protein